MPDFEETLAQITACDRELDGLKETLELRDDVDGSTRRVLLAIFRLLELKIELARLRADPMASAEERMKLRELQEESDDKIEKALESIRRKYQFPAHSDERD